MNFSRVWHACVRVHELFPAWEIKVPRATWQPRVPLLSAKLTCTSSGRLSGSRRWTRGALSAKCFPRTYVLTAGHIFFATPAATPRYRGALSVPLQRGAARHETRRREHAVINLLLLGPVAASYKIKARKAPSTARRELSAQQLRAGHGRARGGQLGAMVVAQLLFALLRRRSRPSDQTVSRHRVSYRILRALVLIGNPATSLDAARLPVRYDIERNVERDELAVNTRTSQYRSRGTSEINGNVGMRDATTLSFLKIILISAGVKFCARRLARNFTPTFPRNSDSVTHVINIARELFSRL